jgi:hypothetical protein
MSEQTTGSKMVILDGNEGAALRCCRHFLWREPSLQGAGVAKVVVLEVNKNRYFTVLFCVDRLV